MPMAFIWSTLFSVTDKNLFGSDNASTMAARHKLLFSYILMLRGKATLGKEGYYNNKRILDSNRIDRTDLPHF